jgi:hypothetical protein
MGLLLWKRPYDVLCDGKDFLGCYCNFAAPNGSLKYGGACLTPRQSGRCVMGQFNW